MITVRCPFTKTVFKYESEDQIPDGLVFERVTEYKHTRHGVVTRVYCATPREAIEAAITNTPCHMQAVPA